jgi:RNA-binding protein
MGITESFISQLNEALEARELIKIHVLEASLLNAKDAANEVAQLTEAEFVQAIGNKFVLYRKSKENNKIDLPN